MADLTKIEGFSRSGLPSPGAQAWWDSVRPVALGPLQAGIDYERTRNDAQDKRLDTLATTHVQDVAALQARLASQQVSIDRLQAAVIAVGGHVDASDQPVAVIDTGTFVELSGLGVSETGGVLSIEGANVSESAGLITIN